LKIEGDSSRGGGDVGGDSSPGMSSSSSSSSATSEEGETTPGGSVGVVTLRSTPESKEVKDGQGEGDREERRGGGREGLWATVGGADGVGRGGSLGRRWLWG
jgi:hypothetical protein